MLAWHDAPFDLRRVRWYRTCEDALAAGSDRLPSPPAKAQAEPKKLSARFRGGTRCELRHRGKYWVIAAATLGRLVLRKDFCALDLEHAKRSAETFFGQPVDGWKEEY